MTKQAPPPYELACRLLSKLAAAAAAIACLLLLGASPASAAYEQVGNFAGTAGALKITSGTEGEMQARWPEEVQLGGAGGMAVNYTGAGGVPKGTIYAAVRTLGGGIGIARYNPDGAFSERWSFEGALGGAPDQRCGPEGNPAEPTCTSSPGADVRQVDVDVDQSTGDVYVFGEGQLVGTNLIHVFTPDGSKLITEFGEMAASGETTAASPAKIHKPPAPNLFNSRLAVDSSGDVYAYDENYYDGDYRRLMEFEPQSPGDYEHYVYAGQAHDLGTGFGEVEAAARPVFDAAGHLYASSEERIVELDPSHPEAAPLCEFKFAIAGIEALTVDPLSGEVFFVSPYKELKRVRRLAPCDEATGKFSEEEPITYAPSRVEVAALAFDPVRRYGPSRPPGVLYMGASSGIGGKAEENAKGESLGESSLGYVFARPQALPPEIKSESVAHVTATAATLGAQINPKASATHYAFQYETQAQYEASEPSDRFAGAAESPPGGVSLGEGAEALSVSASVSGLQPDTAYRYRVIATSHCSTEEPEKVCEGIGGDEAFRTFPPEAPGLPDHRAYELVSPAQKEGGEVIPADPSISSCPVECKPGNLLAHLPKQSAPDGNAIAYEGTAFTAGEGALEENEYLARRDPKAGWQSVNLAPPLQVSSGTAYVALSADLDHGVLAQSGEAPLSLQAPSGYQDLFAQPTADPATLSPLLGFEPPNRFAGEFQMSYAGASQDLSRIFFEANDALTGETPLAPEAPNEGKGKFDLYEWHEGSLALVDVLPGNAEAATWLHPSAGGLDAVSADGSTVVFSDEAGQVYARVNGESTLEVPDHAGRFLAAAADGSKVLLSDGTIYDLQAEASTDLTEGKGGFQGIAGQSEDLSRLYFIDTEVLSGEEENEYGAKAQAGKDNLYAWAEGEGTRFIATLLAQDNEGIHSGDWRSPPARTAEASPHGRYLAFLSQAPLSGYDNTGPCANHQAGPCQEAFLYDSATGALSCASCNPSGERPLGITSLRTAVFHYLTDQGRLYFDSRDSLVPADTNEGVEDVYQYEPGEVGTCERAKGCVSLISAGSEPSDSNLLAVDESGKNVFFTTRDQLTLKDHDDLTDLYDAREGGGIPTETEVARTECQGEACQAPVSAPNDPTPGSSTFEGAGNVKGEAGEKKHAKKHRKKRHSKKHANKRAAKRNRGGSK